MTKISWTNEKIFEYIKARVDKNLPINPLAVAEDNSYVYKTASKKFDGWNNAVKAAGFEPQKVEKKHKWTEEKIIQSIHEYHKAGKPLNASYMIEKNQQLYLAARKNFKSWNNALIAAGCNPGSDEKSRQLTFRFTKS